MRGKTGSAPPAFTPSTLGANISAIVMENTDFNNDFDFSTNAIRGDRAAARNQQIAMSRLARSKWRRDPIKERLLFLTGTGCSKIESPEYVKYLEDILEDKHFEHESDVIKSLASLEKDREFLWRVKRDIDFAALEEASLEQERANRTAEEAEGQDGRGKLLSGPKEMNFYTIAPRTYGLDANRNVEKVKESHKENQRKNVASGKGYDRYTRLLDLNEQTVGIMKPMIVSQDAREMYVKSEAVIQDTMTVEEQEEEEREKEKENAKMATIAEE